MSVMTAEPQHPEVTATAGLHVRRAAPEDAAAVAATHVASWRVGYGGLLPDALLASLSVEERTASWTRNLGEGSEGRTFVALAEDGAVLGFATVGRCRDDASAPETGELWAMYAHPDAWRHGVGSALMGAAKQEMRAMGFQRATLWVLTANERARRFYESHGWHSRERHRVDWRGDVRLDEVQYELPALNP